MRHPIRTMLVVTAAGQLVARAARRTERCWAANDDPTGGRPLELPDGDEGAATSADGATIALTRMGRRGGRPIVLAHGWTADRRVWASVARRLVAGGHHVVVYDQRGHGRSSVGAAGMTVTALAGDITAVLEEVDARGAVLAGHSMGGMAVQAFATLHGDMVADRVAELVLLGTACRSPVLGGPGGLGERATVAATANPMVGRLFAHRRAGPWMVRSSLGRHPSIVALRATQETLVATLAATRKAFLTDMAGLDLTASVPTIPVPTTVVWGTRDLLTLPALNRQVADLIPGARRVELHGCGHQLPFEAPDQLADILADAARR